MRRVSSTKRNYIIAGLCMILVIMGVGYAAFSSQLKISGTSNITSNWSVKITDIQSKVVSGTPANASEPTHTDTTATFRTTLTSPGDTMQYDVTVLNEGDIDAKLDKITVPESTNPAIGFEVSGIEEGSLLKSKETALLTVTVKYNNVTEQPSNLTADLKVTLDYSQAPEGYVPPVTGPSIGGQPVEIVESGDGLYEDTYESGRYVYKGANPNNYIEFDNGEIWRIVAKEADGTYKILKNDLLPGQPWDTASSNNWARPATLNTYLNGEYLSSLDSSIKDNIVSHTWGIGVFAGDSNSNGEVALGISEEKSETWNGNIGLIAPTDYLRANSNDSQCNSGMLLATNTEICNTTNWMFNSDNWWTISPYAGDSRQVWPVYYDGALIYSYAYDFNYAPRPAVYLKSDITLSGSGTPDDPFTIVQ